MKFDTTLPDKGFTEPPNSWRPLKLTTPIMQGWDCYAVQTALQGCGMRLPQYGADGFWGQESDDAVEQFQKLAPNGRLVVDRIAGGATQRELLLQIGRHTRGLYGLPRGLHLGVLERESSVIPGNYCAVRPDGHRDIGPVARNDEFTPWEEGFNCQKSIDVWGAHVMHYYNRYRSWGCGEQRSWELAAGSWNAHAWTDRLANGETLAPEQQQHIDTYIAVVMSYVRW